MYIERPICHSESEINTEDVASEGGQLKDSGRKTGSIRYTEVEKCMIIYQKQKKSIKEKYHLKKNTVL